MQNLTDATFQAALETPGGLVVDFWAAWCAPCRKLGPIIDDLAATHPDVRFAKVDIDANPALAAGFAITSVPTVIGFRDGIPVTEARGSVTKRHVAAIIDPLR